MPTTPPPPDVTVTETTDADEARRVVSAVDAALVAAEGAGVVDEAGRRALEHRGLAGARMWVASTDGRPVGFALLRRVDRAGDLALAVEPGPHRGRHLGAVLAERALAAPEASGRVLAWSHADHPAARRLAARHGFDAVRELLVMGRPATDLPAVPERDDVRIRSLDPARPADEQAVIAINAAAFAHHPEQGAMDARDFAERTSSDWYDPAGLLLAEDASTGEVLGFHWTKSTWRDDAGGSAAPGAPGAQQVGEVYVVGIAPAAQGRGLGKLLTAAGLQRLAARGATWVELYVEGDNAPARAVYSGLGFTVRATHVQYARG